MDHHCAPPACFGHLPPMLSYRACETLIQSALPTVNRALLTSRSDAKRQPLLSPLLQRSQQLPLLRVPAFSGSSSKQGRNRARTRAGPFINNCVGRGSMRPFLLFLLCVLLPLCMPAMLAPLRCCCAPAIHRRVRTASLHQCCAACCRRRAAAAAFPAFAHSMDRL